MQLESKLKVFDKKLKNQQEEVKNKLAELLQGVQGLCQSSSDLHDTRLDMTHILEQIEKASSIDCIRFSEKNVNQFVVDWTKDEKAIKEGKASATTKLEEESNIAGATAAENKNQIPVVEEEGSVYHSRLDFQEGRLVLHCLGGPSTDADLLLMVCNVLPHPCIFLTRKFS